ncbi:uncharacterized protein C8Q71DRAFT_858862 [Rhodofomes roseus]|uniref:Uncharacterized protein n=1 Tax=Rhodofomes roseus TaxID=34475 RepID=A0ABQ8KC88_9APHY|nr:uncharacterized protein C8Q71DRAFT_858862 [Rhodofomes roseus]KAH9835208.1 hypothetical protein C8Q71DRAFT_858862 [Rhodofomes roseus]
MSEEERQVRRRAQLHQILHDPTIKSIHLHSPAPVIPPPPTPTRLNTVHWASEAAKATEGARTASIHTASSSSHAQPSAYAYAPPTSPSVPYAAPRMRPHQVRTTSTDSLKTMKILASASNLTRMFLQPSTSPWYGYMNGCHDPGLVPLQHFWQCECPGPSSVSQHL